MAIALRRCRQAFGLKPDRMRFFVRKAKNFDLERRTVSWACILGHFVVISLHLLMYNDMRGWRRAGAEAIQLSLRIDGRAMGMQERERHGVCIARKHLQCRRARHV